MRGTDIEAIGELAGGTLAAGGGFIKQMHEGIAGRPFGVLEDSRSCTAQTWTVDGGWT